MLSEKDWEKLEGILRSDERTEPWSENVRLYVLLRIATGSGEEDLTDRQYAHDELLAAGLSDYAIPYTHELLPPIIRKQSVFSRRLLQLQEAVKDCADLIPFGGTHAKKVLPRHFNSVEASFTTIKEISRGTFGSVESVQDSETGRVFARKTMRRSCEGTMSQTQRLALFKNEVEVTRKAQQIGNPHIVQLVASYTDSIYFALLLLPVAERNLHDLLAQPAPISSEDKAILRLSFGCLVSGLASLHSVLIRHKDVKPKNIIVSGTSLLFCDFGSARDAEFKDTTETEGIARNRTPRYLSPEAHSQKPRNEACDVWSLGCVFLEMLTVLIDISVDELLEYVRRKINNTGPTQDICYWMAADSDIFQSRLGQIAQDASLPEAAKWTAQMVTIMLHHADDPLVSPVLILPQMKRDPSSRPTAEALMRHFQDHAAANPESGHIGPCCIEAPVPAIPERQQFSLPTSEQRQPHLLWKSEHSTATNGPFVGDHPQMWRRAGGSLDSGYVTKPRTDSSSSQVQSAHRRSESTLNRRVSAADTLVFEAILNENPLQILQGNPSDGTFATATSVLHLYESRKTDLYLSTRRLVFLISGSDSVGLDFWLPLADITIERRDTHVLLSWSDCDHDSQEKADGTTLHSRVYSRTHLNNTVLIHFWSVENAREFTMKMNQPCDGMLSLRDSPIDLSPYPAQSAWTLTENDEAMRNSMPDRVTHTVQAFDCPDINNRSTKRGLLVRGRDDTAASTSRIYWLPEMIDMMLGTEVEGSFSRLEPGINLIGLLAVDYKSDVQGVRGYQAPKHGSCASAEYSKCHTIWTFISLEGIVRPMSIFQDAIASAGCVIDRQTDRYKLLNSIGSWALWYCVTTNDLSVKRKPLPHRHGMADLFFWVHEGSGTAALTFRMRKSRPQKPCWITGRRKPPLQTLLRTLTPAEYTVSPKRRPFRELWRQQSECQIDFLPGRGDAAPQLDASDITRAHPNFRRTSQSEGISRESDHNTIPKCSW